MEREHRFQPTVELILTFGISLLKKLQEEVSLQE
jgi:hypothetical protein